MLLYNISRLSFMFTVIFMLCGCGDHKQKKEWDDIDYSKVRGREAYENDKDYSPPSVLGCTSDDLYNCN